MKKIYKASLRLQHKLGEVLYRDNGIWDCEFEVISVSENIDKQYHCELCNQVLNGGFYKVSIDLCCAYQDLWICENCYKKEIKIKEIGDK